MTKREDGEKIADDGRNPEDDEQAKRSFRRLSTDGWEIPSFFEGGKEDSKADPDQPDQEAEADGGELAAVTEPAPENEAPEPEAKASNPEEEEPAPPDEEPEADADGSLASEDELESPLEDLVVDQADQTEELEEETPSPQLEEDDGGYAHRWLLGTALVTIIVALAVIVATRAWQPYACKTTFEPFVQAIQEQPDELPRWFPSEDCRGEKECIFGICQSEEVWLRTNWVNRLITIFRQGE